jgi:hypothetical protein
LPQNFMEENAAKYQNYQNIHLVFQKNSIRMNTVETNKSNFKNELTALLKLPSEDKQTMLHLNFNRNLLYQDYLFYKTIIHNLSNENILINKNEFIYN